MQNQVAFWDFQVRDIINACILVVTIFAVYYGPIKAVKIARENDDRRDKKRRQFDIFSNLMKTRRTTLDPVRINSLNLVEVEFYGFAPIISAYKSYIITLEKSGSQTDPEQVHAKIMEDREDAYLNLLHQIGKELGFGYDKHDLKKYSYVPQGWQHQEEEVQTFRRLVIELLNGHRPIAIKKFSKNSLGDKFPPAPDAN